MSKAPIVVGWVISGKEWGGDHVLIFNFYFGGRWVD